MYSKRDDDDNNNQNYTDGVINKSGKLKLEFDTGAENGSILRWEFRTFEHDIKFGIYSIDIDDDKSKTNTGDKVNEIPLGRVSSHEIDEIGFINCRPNAKC